MSKVCEICAKDSFTDVLWTCVGCTRKFHATCVGIPVTRTSARIKKVGQLTVDPTSFLLPCCEECQSLVSTTFEVKTLAEQQKLILEQQKELVDANQRIAADVSKLSVMGALFSDMEQQIEETVSVVNLNTTTKVENAESTLSRDIVAANNMKSNDLVDLKNHLTTLFNISSEATRDRIDKYVTDLTDDLERELKRIAKEVHDLSSAAVNMAAHCTEHSSALSHTADEAFNLLKENVLSEVKSLGNAISNLEHELKSAVNQNIKAPPETLLSLHAEFHAENADKSGWRLIGSKRIWKPDWTDYDERKKRRMQQQKNVEAARKRRNRRKQAYLNNTNNDTHNNNNNGNNNRASRSSDLPNRNHVYSNNNNNNYHRGQSNNFNTNSNRRYTNPNRHVNNSLVNRQQNNVTNSHND
ncbi:uncharacterized protein DDB_G0287625-like [Wyeomyia smithii]|uniref:uncharacterized protein DDB_G0287625-like n=1 Tax=Wyeomyia smithii TaxID=174621 RepID=UPI002467D08C|nr:uncharacterized protein DDB_G0287625-like [Wyeomyia smithii]